MKGDHGNMKEPFGGSGKLFCDTTPSPPFHTPDDE